MEVGTYALRKVGLSEPYGVSGPLMLEMTSEIRCWHRVAEHGQSPWHFVIRALFDALGGDYAFTQAKLVKSSFDIKLS